jgi:hypothetical protein
MVTGLALEAHEPILACQNMSNLSMQNSQVPLQHKFSTVLHTSVYVDAEDAHRRNSDLACTCM